MVADAMIADAPKLAELVAERLFTNGSRQRAQRLVLTVDQPQYRDLGGWSKPAAIDQIAEVLRRELEAVPMSADALHRLRDEWQQRYADTVKFVQDTILTDEGEARHTGGRDTLKRCLDEFEAVLESVLTEEWQDIATTPKDGSSVLLYFPLRVGDPIVLARWSTIPHLSSDGAWQTISGKFNLRSEPTHWMPLPAPPVPSGGVIRPARSRLASGRRSRPKSVPLGRSCAHGKRR